MDLTITKVPNIGTVLIGCIDKLNTPRSTISRWVGVK